MSKTHILTSKVLIKAVSPSETTLTDDIAKKIRSNVTIKLFYGETFDQFGLTLDSLKYYLFLGLLALRIQSQGSQVTGTIVQADVASSLNKSAQDKKELLSDQLNKRLNLLKSILTVYQLPVEVKTMSTIFETQEYQENKQVVFHYAQQQDPNSSFFTSLKKTVLQNKIHQEKKAGFQYALEAIATAMCFDIKIGPPREMYYDLALQQLAQEEHVPLLNSIYLLPSFPLGQNFAFFLNHPQIEEFGVTPYKAGSNKLQEKRIILGSTSFSQAKRLIHSSFESLNPKTVHPVYDIYTITQMAKCLTESIEFSLKPLADFESVDELKKVTVAELKKYIYLPLKLK